MSEAYHSLNRWYPHTLTIMPHIRIVLVGPKYEGNIGAICRSMTNFGLDDLVLVNPCAIGIESYRRAKHGSDILDNAKVVSTIREAIEGCTIVAGTSGVTTVGDKNFNRVPLAAREFASKIKDFEGNVAILFGREDVGLVQQELENCDVLVSVPTNSEYPILNLSHAATIIMYELFDGELHEPIPASTEDKERMFDMFEQLMEAGDYPEQRRKDTTVMFRRLMGRAVMTNNEFRVLMGVFNDAVKTINGKRRPL